MRLRRTCALALVALTPLLAQTAHAGGTRASAGTQSGLRQTAPKDCTRLNGRMAYYGNPWCNAAEQRAWDLWDARRRTISAGN